MDVLNLNDGLRLAEWRIVSLETYQRHKGLLLGIN